VDKYDYILHKSAFKSSPPIGGTKSFFRAARIYSLQTISADSFLSAKSFSLIIVCTHTKLFTLNKVGDKRTLDQIQMKTTIEKDFFFENTSGYER